MQTPAFLCRQTNFIVNVCSQGKPVNIKKGQFLSPWEMSNVVEKARSTGNAGSWSASAASASATTTWSPTCARSRSCAPSARRSCSTRRIPCSSRREGLVLGGQREFVPVLARAAVAAGVAGIFMETHPDPDKALSDGPNAWPLPRMRELLTLLVELDRSVKSRPFAESAL
jgi:2-dehydro-3-deoxyphosphooctonate aldolase (KDO 8-P synthase)